MGENSAQGYSSNAGFIDVTYYRVEVGTSTMYSLSDNSCPGVDGLTPKFYKKYWGILKKDLRDAYQHMFESGEMPMSLSEGLIYLIPKT